MIEDMKNRTDTHSNEPLSVLIIDDDESVRVSLKFHFDDCGFRTHSVETAEEALDLMGEVHVDAVIVDLRLPGIDGMEFIRQASKSWPDAKYVIYTGSPVAIIPDEILTISTVSPRLFFKPISDLSELSDEIDRITAKP